MKHFLYLTLLLVVQSWGAARIDRPVEDKCFIIATASYKNAQWFKFNIDSLLSQDYPKDKYKIIYVDDNSPDGSRDLVLNYLEEKAVDFDIVTFDYDQMLDVKDTRSYIEMLSNKIHESKKNSHFIFVENKQRKLALHNLIMAIYACDDKEIIVEVDGDDALANSSVLSQLNKAYLDSHVWLTYGQFKFLSNDKNCAWNKAIPSGVIKRRSIRRYPHLPTHLRTFYAGLFKKIKLEDLMYNDKFLEMTWDVGFMLPMIEMAGFRFKYFSKPLLIYNDKNDINDHKVNKRYQLDLSKIIRRRAKYSQLNNLF